MVGHVLKTFFKRNEIRDGIENGLNLVQDTCIGLLLRKIEFGHKKSNSTSIEFSFQDIGYCQIQFLSNL